MDLTRTAVNNFATHCSKLKPEITGSALKSLERTLQHKPNYFMDTTKFIKRLATYVAVEHTAFIVPIEDDRGSLCGWYPLRAQRCEVVEAAGQVYLRYQFANGDHAAIEFERVGILTDFEYTDELFGEDNRTLKPTMQLIHTQNEGIINAVKNSANIRFLAKVANMLKPEDIKKERQRFTEDNLSADNDSGMIIYTMADCLPFNAVYDGEAYDRVYKAEDWAWYFATFLANGVFPKPSDGLQVIAHNGMEIRVNAGQAFINGYAFRNTSSYSITLDTAEGALNRIDRVIVRWDLPQRRDLWYGLGKRRKQWHCSPFRLDAGA